MTTRHTLKLALVGAMAAGGLAVVTAPALADEPPADQKMVVASASAAQNPNESTVIDFAAGYSTAAGGDAPAGTHVVAGVYSCGHKVGGMDYTGHYGGKPAILVNFSEAQQKLIGRSIEFTATFTYPGYDSYSVTSSYSGYSVKRPSCAKINSGGSAKTCHVTRWSKKLPTSRGTSVPVAGATVRISKAKATAHCHVTYTWTLTGHKVVGHRTRLHLEKAWTGQRLAVTVKAAKKGHRKATRTLRYGRIR